MNKLIAFIILIFTPFVLNAQLPRFVSVKTINNQKDLSVNALVQDEYGFIWVGTDNGLIRLKNENNDHFTEKDSLCNNLITTLEFNSDGELWIGHKTGEISIVKKGQIKRFNPEEGLSSRSISDIHFEEKNGTLWFATMGEGVYYFTGDVVKRLYMLDTMDGLADNHVYSIAQHDDNLYFATDNGISVYNIVDKEFIDRLSMKDGLPDNIVKKIKIVNDSLLWAATEDGGICTYDILRKRFIHHVQIPFGGINDFVLANDLYVVTSRNGVFRIVNYKRKDYRVQSFSKQQGITNQKGNCIFADRESLIWVGLNSELIRTEEVNFEFLNEKEDFDLKNIYSLDFSNDTTLWIASESGIYKFNPFNIEGLKNVSPYVPNSEWNKYSFINVYVDSNKFLWACTYGYGVYRVNVSQNSTKLITVDNGLANNNVIHISENDSSLIFSTLGGGVSIMNKQRKTFKNFSVNEGLLSNYVYSTYIDNTGKIWIGMDGAPPQYLIEDQVATIQLKDSVDINGVYSYTEDNNGIIWANTANNGLAAIKDSLLFFINESSGLKNIDIKSVAKLEKELLLLSNSAIDVFNPELNCFCYYGEISNVRDISPNLNAFTKDKEGNVWVGMNNGIVKYIPANNLFNSGEPKVYIENIELFFESIEEGKNSFSYDENHFSFYWTGLWYQNKDQLIYRYMLDGFDLEWTETKSPNPAVYSSLPEGVYYFKIQATNKIGYWGDAATDSYKFTIRAPFWKTTWFILVVLIALSLMIYGFIRLRTAKLELERRRLENEVNRRTEEIRNKNKEIEAHRDEIEAQRDEVEKQRDYIWSQNKNIKDSILYASRIQEAVLPPKADFKKLMKDFFLINRPRDIVSGDFYYINKLQDKFVIAAADCTGHGVPGAFMSLLGVSFMDDIIKNDKVLCAAEILEKLREKVINSLRQTGADWEAKDGMDMAMIVLDEKNMTVDFAGALNPLYLLRDGEMKIYKGDRMPIGIHPKMNKKFTSHTVPIKSKDRIYIFSDGYADQVNENFQKIKIKRFRELLIETGHLPMKEQKLKLESFLNKWMAKADQIDDILVIGIKI